MKKIFLIGISLFIAIIVISISVLSTKGLETNKFNEIIYENVQKRNKDISLKLNKISFKFDIKNFSLFLKTQTPSFKYKKLDIPIKEIKVYLNLASFLKSKTKIEKVNITFDRIKVEELKKIILKTKPSSLNSLIVNKINKGLFTADLELYLNENLTLENIIARGKVEKMDANIINKLDLIDSNFEFFADKTDVLIKNLNANLDGILIEEGDIRIEKNQFISLKSNFLSKIKFNKKNFKKYSKFLNKFEGIDKENISLSARLNHNFRLIFDKTYKLSDYSYESKGSVEELSFKLKSPYKSQILKQEIKNLEFKELDVSLDLNSKNKNNMNINGTYSFDNLDYNKFKLKNNFSNNTSEMNSEIEYDGHINLDSINYIKEKGKKAKIFLNTTIKDEEFLIKKLVYEELKNRILVQNLKINKKKLISLEKINVKTNYKNITKNDFEINFGKSIKVIGKKYDATNLNKILNRKGNNNFFEKITKKINIEFNEIETNFSNKLKNFKLLGDVYKGKFIKISSKGDFGNNKFLDISLKNDKKNKKKYLEIYSDLPKPLLTEYSFFNGLKGGTLIYSSIIEFNESNSKLIIENFKIKDAPGLVKLLSLADFGGLADLAEGEGLSFEKLEIVMSDKNGFLELTELYAVGPSISILMEGYKESNGLISLRGTLVPAKNLNKIISKIPVIGKIVIPKDVGEGLFGVSFKIKGMPGEVKTTIDPLKTLTPRFITKALEKTKKTK